jgi:hypothetical protein
MPKTEEVQGSQQKEMPAFKPDIQYFVETDAARGNKSIFELLHTPEPDAMERLRDRRGEPHRVWQISEDDAKTLLNSRADVDVKFTIWKRLENSGPIYRVYLSSFTGKFSSKKYDPLEGGRVFKTLDDRPVAPFRDEDIPF